MVKLNYPYTQKELASEIFGISPNTFKNRKAAYIEKLNECYVWYRYKSKYVLTEEIKPYDKSVGSKRASKFEIQQEYRPSIMKTVKKDPVQNSNTIARSLQDNNDPITLRHPQTIQTMSKYIRNVLKVDYGVNGGEWVYVDENYRKVPLTQEQLLFIQNKIKNPAKKPYTGDQLNFIAHEYVANGLWTEEEAKNLVYHSGDYDYFSVIDSFEKEYGFRPHFLPKLQEGIAFDAKYIIPDNWKDTTDNDELGEKYPKALKQDIKDGKKVFE